MSNLLQRIFKINESDERVSVIMKHMDTTLAEFKDVSIKCGEAQILVMRTTIGMVL